MPNNMCELQPKTDNFRSYNKRSSEKGYRKTSETVPAEIILSVQELTNIIENVILLRDIVESLHEIKEVC